MKKRENHRINFFGASRWAAVAQGQAITIASCLALKPEAGRLSGFRLAQCEHGAFCLLPLRTVDSLVFSFRASNGLASSTACLPVPGQEYPGLSGLWMASVQTWILSKSKNRRGRSAERSSRKGDLNGGRCHFHREVQGKLRSAASSMRKPKNGSEGKDRLRALAAAAAKAASSNIATYFADDDKPVNFDGGCPCAPL